MAIETNGTDRVPLIKDPTQVFDIFNANDLLKAAGLTSQPTAPDGVARTPLLENAKYIIHANFTWPKCLLPVTTNTVSALATEIVGAQARTKAFAADLLSEQLFWGREVNQFILTDMIFVDIGDSGAGLTSIFLNLVGGSRASRLTFTNTTFTKFAYLGQATDFTLSFNPNVNFVQVGRGFAFDMSPYDVVPGANGFLGWRTINPTPVTLNGPYIGFTGSHVTTSINAGISTMDTADEFMRIDANTTGEFDIVGNSYDGVGTFISEGATATNNVYLNYDLTVDSFSDSTEDPGVDTTVNVPVPTLFHRGQTVLIGDEAAYDGEYNIIRVAADQLSFDINVVHSTSGAGTIKQTRVNATGHGFIVKEHIVISGTTNYDGTHHISEVLSNNAYIIPFAFVADDATGTAISTSKTQADNGVTAKTNGVAQDSRRVASGNVNGNSGNTSFSAQDTYIGMNLSMINDQLVTERFTLTNATVGLYRYDDPRPITVRVDANLWIVKTTSTASYRFALDKNGVVPVWTTAITSVTDSSGVARFNFTVGPTLTVEQQFMVKGFTTNTDYNGMWVITATGAGYFEVESIAFGSDETGEFENPYSIGEVKTSSVMVSFTGFMDVVENDTMRIRIGPDGHTDLCTVTDMQLAITEA